MRAPATELPILFNQVSFVHSGAALMSDLRLALYAGAPTVVIGPNGSGKTTLLRLAMGLIEPSAGSITWAGRSCTTGRRLALVSQRPVMLRRSAYGNVRYALAAAEYPWRHRRARAEELLAQVGLAAHATRPARHLSGGEQQRLALARALARDPEVLFLDEPTASLDPANTRATEEIIASVAAAGVKVVITTHDLGQARRLAGDVVLLIGGLLCEHAKAEDFFCAPTAPQAAAFLRGDLVI